MVREETWLTEPKRGASRQLVCDWVDVSEDVLRLYVARRLQSEVNVLRGITRPALRDLTSPDDELRTTCIRCGEKLEGQSTKYCSRRCAQTQSARDRYWKDKTDREDAS